MTYLEPWPLEPPEPVVACICRGCRQPIADGEECMEIDGECYHLDCFKDNAVDILYQLGARKVIAEAV